MPAPKNMTPRAIPTVTAAKAAARAFGYTIRKTTPGESELVVYRAGTGQNDPAAYFTDCPLDALDTARAMARRDLDKEAAALLIDPDSDENRHTIESVAADMGLTPEPRRAKPARRKAMTRRDLAAMAADCEASPVARDLAALSLAAVSVASDSGAFPLYAFRDGADIGPDELDSLAYGPAYAGLI